MRIQSISTYIYCFSPFLLTFWLSASPAQAAERCDDKVHQTVNEAIRPLMAKDDIAGAAVGVVIGARACVFNYGVASKATGKPVTEHTLFELGSVSKTFTATLAAYAQVRGDLSLTDPVGKFLHSLDGTAFGKVSLLELGTHTPGGLPLQVPDDVQSTEQLIRYFRSWQPQAPPGTVRTYSNLGIGTLGLITARSMGEDFAALMQQRLFRALGMKNSFIQIPDARMADYAEGYSKQGQPVRMTTGVLSDEAYGIKATAADMVLFLRANLGIDHLDRSWRRAIAVTRREYFQAGPLTQDLIWEQYPYPVPLGTLIEGNSPHMIFDATPASPIVPPQPPRKDAWLNKTGSTNGFGAYLAFLPQQRLGIVILSNRNIPIEDRVRAAYEILTALAKEGSGKADAQR